ncbi:VOC family protein [Iocasia frigidifontis]|uniref:hypothetical protein n=1 Tax=Iocasia fonsfrigidae TaxID=2682810 RepID=UPI001E321C82|nr:hypothetical protein [Iocasia fonsfrigidae]
MAGNIWIALNLDEKELSNQNPDYSHIAFNVLSTEYPKLKKRLMEAGVKTFKNNTSEGH